MCVKVRGRAGGSPRAHADRRRLSGPFRAVRALWRDESAQATVEAAFALPIMLLLMLLLLQPSILLYDRMVMQGAAAEGCRLLATASGGADTSEDYLRRRLSAVPQHELFHVHEGGCTWEIQLSGDESSPEVSVSLSTEVRPLPLVATGAAFFGLVNERGNLEVRVTSSLATQPSWAFSNGPGGSPSGWIESWR